MNDAVYLARASDLAEAAEKLIKTLETCSAMMVGVKDRAAFVATFTMLYTATERFRAAEKQVKELSA